MQNKNVIEAIRKLRENEKRKFVQTVDLIINLRSFDIKKESVNLFLNLPHKIRDVQLAAFFEKKSSFIPTISKPEFDGYKEKKKIKNLVKSYDFFIASPKVMPSVATTFGRYLGPAGKMPSPQLGIVKEESEAEIKELIQKFEKVVKVKSKEPSLKFSVAKENMKDEDIAQNIEFAYNQILNALPKKKENIKSVMIKFSMTKPVRIAYE